MGWQETHNQDMLLPGNAWETFWSFSVVKCHMLQSLTFIIGPIHIQHDNKASFLVYFLSMLRVCIPKHVVSLSLDPQQTLIRVLLFCNDRTAFTRNTSTELSPASPIERPTLGGNQSPGPVSRAPAQAPPCPKASCFGPCWSRHGMMSHEFVDFSSSWLFVCLSLSVYVYPSLYHLSI